MNTKSGLLAIALCAVAGCGGSVMSPSKLAASEGSVRGAEEVGARQLPRAGLHLKLAQEELAKAKVASHNGDGEIADRLLQRSQADADLAIALANEASADNTANKTIDKANEATEQAREGVK